LKPSTDFSRRCRLAIIAHTLLLTHPHRLTIRGSLHAGPVCV
jgi:hypothetical protein